MTKQDRKVLFDGNFKRPMAGRLKAFLILIAMPVIIPVAVVFITIFIIKVLFEIIRWDDKDKRGKCCE